MQQKKKVRPLFAALLAALLLMALLPLPAYAADDYTLDSSGQLTIHDQDGMGKWIQDTRGGLDKAKVNTLVVEAGVTKINDYAFWNCTSLTSVTLPDSMTEIGEGAFNGCKALSSLTIPPNVKKINQGVFALCSGLTSVTLPDSVTEIADSAFLNCVALQSLTIPPNVTSIGGWVFKGCTALASLTIPPKVTSIGEGAFENCSMLTTLTFQGQKAPELKGNNVFLNVPASLTINVPYGATGYVGTPWDNYTIVYAPAPEPAAPAPEAEGVPHVCYFGDWQYSNEHHWKRCSCMALSDYAPHVFNGARVCTVCGYGAKPKKVNPQTGVYDSGLPQSFSKPLLFHFAPLIGA